MDTPGSFGEWLKRRRKALDLTQEELAQRTGCSIFALRKIEAGYRRPSKQLAGLLAAALEIPTQEQSLFTRAARGEIALERIGTLKLDRPRDSLSELLSLAPSSDPVGSELDTEPPGHHLPVPATPLLGRDPELAALERIFKDPQCRLMTLTGMGGIGKTRLAIEFATRQQGLFPGGVYYVSLAPVNAAESTVSAIAEVLGHSFSGPMDIREQLIRHMSIRMRRPALLVLDNLEHLIARSSYPAELISDFLQRLPQIKILTTSRERLNLQGEWMYELHGLPVPPAEYFERLDDYSAAVLFIQSARRIKSDFEIGPAEQNDLVRLCRLVEGIPLALELAAVWVCMLTCAEIAQEIGSNIDFLSTSTRDVPERHRSMKATFEHSWRLLSVGERDVLARMSVFQGGFDRTAAESVAGASLPLLASLVSKSLVRRTQTGRYDLHEVVRQFARANLAGDEAACLETRDRHSDYYLDMVSRYERKLKSAQQQAAVRELTLELDNLRAAWTYGIESGKFDSLGRAVRSLGWFYEVSGLVRDGIDQLELLIQKLRAEPADARLKRVIGASLVQQGLLYFRTGRFQRSQTLYRESISILRSIGDQPLLADALIFLGTLMHLNGEYLEAKKIIEEGLAFAQASGDPWFMAYGIYNLGHVESQRGEYQKGYERMQQGIQLWRELGDPHSISLGLNFMVDTQIKLGRYEEAQDAMLESVALCEQTKNRWGMGTAYRYLGRATLAGGRSLEAQEYLHKSLQIFGEYFEGWDIARTLTYLGDALFTSGDLADARSKYMDALSLALHVLAIPIALDALAGLARLDIQTGGLERAFTQLSLVLEHPASTNDTREYVRELMGQVVPALSPERLEHLRETAAGQSLDSVANGLLFR